MLPGLFQLQCHQTLGRLPPSSFSPRVSLQPPWLAPRQHCNIHPDYIQIFHLIPKVFSTASLQMNNRCRKDVDIMRAEKLSSI